MNILVIGEEKNFNECREKFGRDHEYTWLGEHRDFEGFLDKKDLVFDFTIDEDPTCLETYSKNQVIVFFNVCMVSLAELVSLAGRPLKCTIFGFNGMPTLLNTPLMEVSVWREEDKDVLAKTCAELNTKFSIVDDRVGLVTPRIISMIINEAYYTVQEGTASRADIDNAMKLGTNYPYGPFEWCERIGVRYVYELLEALYEETKDERYKICALLKKDYLRVNMVD
jgi:3-hydroxybutyryl-CoA dehydrogenase